MSSTITRRSLTACLSAAAAGLSAQAQAPPAPLSDDNSAASALRRNAADIAKVEVPQNTEPAFRFEA